MRKRDKTRVNGRYRHAIRHKLRPRAQFHRGTLKEESVADLIGDEGEEGEADAGGGARVWRLNNKYYSARVQVRPAAGEALAPRVQAHVVLLQPHEASTGRGGAARRAGRGGRG